MVLVAKKIMMWKFVFLCVFIVAVFFGTAESTTLRVVEKMLNHALNSTFVKPFSDLLNPKVVLKSKYKTVSDKQKALFELVGVNDKVIKASKATAPELIRMHGYHVEEHTVTTDDRYIFDIHRIPHGRNGCPKTRRGVVLIPPSFLCTSACWVILGPKRALPYLLADMGYDVWLSNVRGSTYGRKHKFLNPERSSTFWLWSFHEIGTKDFPATIDYILHKTQQKDLILIAHSVSSSAAFVMLSEMPKYTSKIKAQFILAPTAYMNNLKSPILYFIAQFVDISREITHLTGQNDFLPPDEFLSRLGGDMCKIDPIAEILCTNAMFVLAGFNRKSINETQLPIIFGQSPAGTSVMNMIHYGQIVRLPNEEFQLFDHGLSNFLKYFTVFPPSYKINKITAHTFCFYGKNDWLISEKNALKTCSFIYGHQKSIAVKDPEWMHNDFLYGSAAKEQVYNEVIELMKNYS